MSHWLTLSDVVGVDVVVIVLTGCRTRVVIAPAKFLALFVFVQLRSLWGIGCCMGIDGLIGLISPMIVNQRYQ